MHPRAIPTYIVYISYVYSFLDLICPGLRQSKLPSDDNHVFLLGCCLLNIYQIFRYLTTKTPGLRPEYCINHLSGLPSVTY